MKDTIYRLTIKLGVEPEHYYQVLVAHEARLHKEEERNVITFAYIGASVISDDDHSDLPEYIRVTYRHDKGILRLCFCYPDGTERFIGVSAPSIACDGLVGSLKGRIAREYKVHMSSVRLQSI